LPNDSKHNEATFFKIFTDLLCLRVSRMSRSRDLAIFVLTIDKQTDRQTDCITPCCVCARGINIPSGKCTILAQLLVYCCAHAQALRHIQTDYDKHLKDVDDAEGAASR
jgi:hypothetical protein